MRLGYGQNKVSISQALYGTTQGIEDMEETLKETADVCLCGKDKIS